jgi:hypothetical protein
MEEGFDTGWSYELRLRKLEEHTENYLLFKQLYIDEECIVPYRVGECGPICPYTQGFTSDCDIRPIFGENLEVTMTYSIDNDGCYECVATIFFKCPAPWKWGPTLFV